MASDVGVEYEEVVVLVDTSVLPLYHLYVNGSLPPVILGFSVVVPPAQIAWAAMLPMVKSLFIVTSTCSDLVHPPPVTLTVYVEF